MPSKKKSKSVSRSSKKPASGAKLAGAKSGARRLFLEIGTEELPANYLAYGDQDGQALFRNAFVAAFNDTVTAAGSITLDPAEIRIFLTPRRIVVDAPFAFNADPIQEEIVGPPFDRAYDPAGKPTPMLEGFLKSKNVDLKDVIKLESKGKACVGYIRRTIPPAPETIIGNWVQAFLRRLTFPKLMWWDETDLRFPRPIRSILCFLDDRIVPFKIGAISNAARFSVFRNGERRAFKAASVKDYLAQLAKHGVLLDQAERRRAIAQDLAKLTQKAGGADAAQDALLEEITYLTECPVAYSGEYDADFAQLPSQVLTSSMSKNQRLFSIVGKNGKHLPHYVGFLDGASKNPKAVVTTVSAILKAKLQDARFFFEEDRKLYLAQGDSKRAGLGKLQEDLKNLQYLKGAGSMAQKQERLERAAEKLLESWGVSQEAAGHARKAASLLKVDLLTQMVGEFPELQGTAGGFYLKEAEYQPEVAAAVAEHYLPTSPDSALPSSPAAAALSILDKADIIAVCFALGKLPSSSQDPYALKRSLAGILRTATAKGFRVQWDELMRALLEALRDQKLAENFDVDATLKKLKAFYAERTQYFYEHQGVHREIAESVLEVRTGDILDVARRIDALKIASGTEDFVRTVKVLQRTTNIVKNVKDNISGEPVEELLKEPIERELFAAYTAKRAAVAEAIAEGRFAESVSLYAGGFFDILHGFFDQVLVHAEDPGVRMNRLRLVNSVRALFADDFADLSKVKAQDSR